MTKYTLEQIRDAEGRFISAGALLSEEVTAEVLRQVLKDNPYGRPGPFPPLTLRQRFRGWRAGLRWAIHDRLFPDCCGDDDW